MLKVSRFALSEVHQSPSLSPHLVPPFPTLPHLLCALVYALTYTRARVGL